MADNIGNMGLNLMQNSLDALWLRQKVISDNLANEDTPGYKAKSVEFEKLLQSAVDSADPDKITEVKARVVQDNATTMREDGNNVDVDAQSIELARTQLQYETLVQSISSEISRMKYVITEGRG